jgi:hypothetical protein
MSSGRDTRTSILPKQDPGIGITGPNYDINDNMPTPAEIGVKRGKNLSDAVNAMKGMAYYVDTIGFGESSTNFSKGLKKSVQKYGINYFMPTGARCSNGADMWMYVETIPKGDALGKNAQKAMQQLGMPPLRGLAPGIIEDAKHALNPVPMMSAVFGSGYPKCELVEKQVGDPNGRIQSKEGSPWVYDSKSVSFRGGMPYQKKWIQATSKDGSPILLTRDQYLTDPKTQNRDGTPIEQEKEKRKEGFADSTEDNKLNLDILSLAVAASLTAVAYAIHSRN